MPKLKQNKPEYDAVGRLLKGYGANGSNLARAIVCAPATARKKLAEPKYLTLEDLDRASRHYGIPMDELREAIKK